MIDDGEKMTLSSDEYQQALSTIEKIVSKLDSDYSVVEERGKDPIHQKQQGIVASLMIRRRLKSVEDLLEIRIAVVGNVDAGKVRYQ